MTLKTLKLSYYRTIAPITLALAALAVAGPAFALSEYIDAPVDFHSLPTTAYICEDAQNNVINLTFRPASEEVDVDGAKTPLEHYLASQILSTQDDFNHPKARPTTTAWREAKMVFASWGNSYFIRSDMGDPSLTVRAFSADARYYRCVRSRDVS